MASATNFEYLTASTTVFAPFTTSPEANIPSLVVSPYSFVTKRPFLFVSIPLVLERIWS